MHRLKKAMIFKAVLLLFSVKLVCYANGEERETGITDKKFKDYEYDEEESRAMAASSELSPAGIYSETNSILKNLRYRLDVVPCLTQDPGVK